MRKKDRYFLMNKRRIRELVTVMMTATVLVSACSSQRNVGKAINASEAKKGGISVSVSCHDPQIIVSDGKYYMFGSHMVGAESDDLTSWDYFADGVNANNKLFDNLLKDPYAAFDYVGKNTENGYSVWAPSVIYNEVMRKYVMYFCTTSSYIKSSLCFATADKIKGPYTYVDTILDSGFGQSDIEQTNLLEVLGEDADVTRYLQYGGYNNKEWPNCIDPAIFTDEDGKMWMVYGSWSGGIFLLEIDPATGYPIYPKNDVNADPYYGYHLIGGGHHSVEGPYIEYNRTSGYYYLFVSYGDLNSDGGYQIRQFRSEKPTGPYVDAKGNTLDSQDDHFSYGVKMVGNYTFPSLNYTYMAPGGQSTFKGEDGKIYIVYHQRFDDGKEYHEPRVHQMFVNEDGWFVMAPFATGDEELSEEGYKQEDVEGTFYIVNHGGEIGSTVHGSEEYLLNNGKITGTELNGTYSVQENTNNITMIIDNTTYKGILFSMKDEAGNPVFCFSAVGENNECLWGVQYLEEK